MYHRGCRCLSCARAESLYRRAPRPPRVDATPARDFLQGLAARGVGLSQAARLSGIPRSTLQDIRDGRQASMLAALLPTVLAIPGLPAPRALVRAWPTRRLLAWLRVEGFTDAELARRFGYRNGHMQLTWKHCTVRNAARVRALRRKVAQL